MNAFEIKTEKLSENGKDLVLEMAVRMDTSPQEAVARLLNSVANSVKGGSMAPQGHSQESEKHTA